jgi:Ras homolog gene family, member A
MECSSKEMTGVDEIFEQAILTVVGNDRSYTPQAKSGQPGQSQYVALKRKKRNCRFI